MLVEKRLSEALKDYDKGKKILVLTTMVDGSIACDRLEDLFSEETHFLVDVPACGNPEFAQAIRGMVSPKDGGAKISADNEPVEEPEAFGGGTPKPEVGKSNRQIVEELVLQGKSNREITEKTGIPYQSVWKYAKDIRKRMESCIGANKDRKKCMICQYRGRDPKNKNGCDYIEHEGHSRGCKVEDCNVFVEGERLILKNDMQVMEE